jgi:predicted Holliday junction resolvase-like endonuclease
MVELSVVRDLVAIASFIIALTYYILNIQNQRETRKTQLVMQIYQTKADHQGIRNYFEMINMEWSDPEDFKQKIPDTRPTSSR